MQWHPNVLSQHLRLALREYITNLDISGVCSSEYVNTRPLVHDE